MLAADDTILYVGKARQLKSRVSSYFRGGAHADKTQAMLAQVARVEITVTASETEALLLEYNLIKQHRPRYNVLLKDDKTFPYIHLTAHEFPRLAYYRGAGKVPGRFFGPYPNSVAARETVQLLQKLSRLRPCEDTFFANRSRPVPAAPDRPLLGAVRRPRHARGVRAGHRRRGAGAAGPQQRTDRRVRAPHGGGGRATGVRGSGALPRPDRDAEADPGQPGGDAHQRGRHRRRGDRRRRPGVLRVGRVRARRAQPRQQQFLPEGRARRCARGARRVPGPVLPRSRGAGRDPGRRAGRGRRRARGSARAARRPPGADPQQRARHARALAGDGAHQRGTGPADEVSQPIERARAARGLAGSPRAGAHAAAHRVLRREPHDGRIGHGVVRRVRPGRAREE